MKVTIQPMQPEERLYAYQQSQQIQGQTGSIGYLRADFGKSGAAFYNSWFGHIPSFRGEDFSDDEHRKLIERYVKEAGSLNG